MCQMPNIWHICHTKHKNGDLWDVPNLKNYTTWLQYRCKFATCNDTNRCCKNFIVLYSLFSLLSLHFFFSLLSHSSVPSLFYQSRMFTSSDNGVASMTTTRSATLVQPPSISPLSPRGRRQSHPLPSPLYPPFTLPLSSCGFFFFFFFFLLQFRLI